MLATALPRRLVASLAVVSVTLASPAVGAQSPPEERRAASAPKKDLGLPILARVPADPVLLWAFRTDDLGKSIDELVGFFARFGGDAAANPLDEGFRKLDKKLGASFRNEVLAQLGPELLVVVDLPPVDSLVAGFGSPQTAAWDQLLGRVGFVAGAKDTGRLDRALRRLLSSGDAEVSEANGVLRIAFSGHAGTPAEGESTPASPPAFFYGSAEHVIAFGLSADWVRKVLAGNPGGPRATEAADFLAVTAQLEAKPTSFFYLNTPKLYRMIQESQMVRAIIASNEQSKTVFDALVSQSTMGVGIGSTTVEVAGGARTTTFGPSWMSGWGGGMIPVMAAVAIPNLLNAIDRGKQKRTMADIKMIGVAIESFSIDQDKYPGSPRGEWVDMEAMTSRLVPTYAKTLPRTDGWGHALRYWSDGKSYRIVSPGKDGEVLRDWREIPDEVEDTSFDLDIVFADGAFAYPVEEGGQGGGEETEDEGESEPDEGQD